MTYDQAVDLISGDLIVNRYGHVGLVLETEIFVLNQLICVHAYWQTGEKYDWFFHTSLYLLRRKNEQSNNE